MKRLFAILTLISLFPTPVLGARLYTTGFEQQTVTAGEEFSSNGSPTGTSTTTFRSGLASMRINPSAANSWFGQITATTAATTERTCRIYIRFATRPTTGTPEVVGMWNSVGVTRQAYITYDTVNNTLELRDSADAQVGSDSGATIAADTWYRLELRLLAGTGANATVEAKLDGTTIGTTTTGPSLAFNACYVGTATTAGTYDMYVDDMAINDTSGSAQTGYPGAGNIVMLVPTAAGDDAPAGCQNVAGGGSCPGAVLTNSYQQVDDVNPDDATTFIDIDAVAGSASYNMTDSSTAGIDSYDTVTLVHVYSRRREETSAATLTAEFLKSASGGTKQKATLADGGTTTWRTSQTGGNDAMLMRRVSYTDPTTASAWTPTGTNSIDNMIVGVWNSTTADTDFSAIWANVEYTDGTAPSTTPPTPGDDFRIIRW